MTKETTGNLKICPMNECVYCYYKITHTRHVLRRPNHSIENELVDAMWRFVNNG